ncbi:MAG TPA: NADH-quinone oxidoreductase subunit L [Pyrinomonadaceae bacterium]|nr:NADH-quinone oxidoreductase subunit L [Pyrinomonadaceae bacterium]
MNENNLLSLIIFAPLAGAVINWFVGRRVRNERFIGAVACGSVAISTLIAFYLAFKPDGALRSTQPVFDHLWTWIQVGRLRADFGLALDRLSGVYALFVTFVGFLIHLFAVGYMHGDKGFYRFFAFLNLFMFSMLTLVLADNFLLMFVGWEGVGLCSYLLIGYYLDRQEAGDAAKKAFITNRIGDWGFVLGIMLIFFLTGSVSFFEKPEHGVVSALQVIGTMGIDPFTWRAIFAGGITSAAVLLFIGATGKSAQIPLYVWLPDAMAGPTPVSALIHAATMVTAGVYMIVRCSAIYTHAPTAMFIVALIGAATAIFAATIGLAQNDIKKVLAYSTVSQLGYMFLACGVGAFVAAIFHVVTHAFFKALLFLGSGSVIHGMHHEQDMRHMGGLKKYMKVTFWTMMMGWLAISGIPFWAGFFSKDEILWQTWSASGFSLPAPGWSKALWFVGAVTALLTAVYMTRMMVMTFWGADRFREKHIDVQHSEHEKGAHEVHEPRESPLVMTLPLIVLAVLSTIGGFIGIPYALGSLLSQHPTNYIERALAPVVSEITTGGESTHESPNSTVISEATHSAAEVSEERLLALVSVVIAALGIGLGWLIFQKRPLRRMPTILEHKYYVDEIYDAALIEPVNAFSREGLWKIFDIGVIDGFLHGLGQVVTQTGAMVRHLQAGFVRGYAAIILFGALAVIGFFTYWSI